MRRRLVHAATWAMATGGSVTLAWIGVHTVLAGTAYDPPRTLPVSQSDGGAPTTARPQASSTHRPRPAPSSSTARPPASHTAGSSTPGRTGHPSGGAGNGPARHDTSAPAEDSPSASEGSVRSVRVTGGRAAFDMGDTSATLVSATPDGGWEMRVWKQPSLIRVTFSQGSTEHSIFCRWDGGPPRIERYDN